MTEAPNPDTAPPQAALRDPDEVMRLSTMGAFFPTRLSFMRTLIRRLSRENTQVTRPVWEIDENGFGRAVYSLTLGGHIYSLVAFSTPLDPERRTDRVIAEAWDTSYVLYDGTPSAAEIDRSGPETHTSPSSTRPSPPRPVVIRSELLAFVSATARESSRSPSPLTTARPRETSHVMSSPWKVASAEAPRESVTYTGVPSASV